MNEWKLRRTHLFLQIMPEHCSVLESDWSDIADQISITQVYINKLVLIRYHFFSNSLYIGTYTADDLLLAAPD